jgi:hypothetical protein
VIGTEFTEKGRNGGRYRITGEFCGSWVIERVDKFATPERITTEELRARFGGDLIEPQPVDEVKGWKVLGDKFGQVTERALRGDFDPPAASPEEIFAAADEPPKATRRVGLKEADAKRLGHRKGR